MARFRLSRERVVRGGAAFVAAAAALTVSSAFGPAQPIPTELAEVESLGTPVGEATAAKLTPADAS